MSLLLRIDIFTTVVLTFLTLLAISITLPLVMGRHPSRAARLAQLTLLSQAVGWAALIASGFWRGHWLDWALSTFAMAMASLTPWLMFSALAEWLGPRPGRRLLMALGLAMTVGYALSFPHYALRVGWSNLLLSAQMLLVARAALWPARPARRNWRWLLAGSYLTVGVFTLGRGILGGFFAELYPSFMSPHPINVGAQIASNVLQALATVAVLVAWRDEAEADLRTMATTDGLTRLLNHRTWHERAQHLLSTALRHRHPLVVLLLDLDHFKQINDRHGHEGGDRALALFARLLQSELREGDLCGRLGGEEFAVALNQGTPAGAQTLDARLRQALSHQAPATLGFALGFSAGATALQAGDERMPELLARADQALYRAKAQGRGLLRLNPDAA